MDGIHDLGGKTGYGPVDVAEPQEPFHAPFEGRMWAISRLARAPGVTIDWWRHVREMITPDDYLNRPYFDSWSQTTMASMIDAGVFTAEELIEGAAGDVKSTKPARSYDQVLEDNKGFAFRFDRPLDKATAFAVGDSVETRADPTDGHTRLPAYARGKFGVIHAVREAHIFPDASAEGNEYPEQLYTVSFKAADLWGRSENPDDCVLLDLWESYLGKS